MKYNLLFLFLSFLSLNSFSQELEWKPISENYSIAVISENRNKLLEDSDSLNLEYYQFNPDEKFDLDNFHNSEISYNLTLKDLLQPLEPKQDLQLYKNSEYIIKFQLVQDSISLEIFLKDSISTLDFESLKSNLEKNFGKENVQFISKDEAKKIAKEALGIDDEYLYENQIFPASLDVKIRNSFENKWKIERWKKEFESKKYIEEILAEGIVDFHLLFRIKT